MSDAREDAYQEFRDAILRRVCSVCLDQRDDGSCGLTRRACAIEAHLPGILEALLAVDSDKLEDYEAAIRAQVCSQCGLEDAAGRCRVRDEGTCALDTYLYLVVEAVDQVRQRRLSA